MANADPTAPMVTVACELGNCHRCKGPVLSVTAAHGRPCEHPCHGLDDLTVEARLEAIHFGEMG